VSPSLSFAGDRQVELTEYHTPSQNCPCFFPPHASGKSAHSQQLRFRSCQERKHQHCSEPRDWKQTSRTPTLGSGSVLTAQNRLEDIVCNAAFESFPHVFFSSNLIIPSTLVLQKDHNDLTEVSQMNMATKETHDNSGVHLHPFENAEERQISTK
jgi:hypothetical protein